MAADGSEADRLHEDLCSRGLQTPVQALLLQGLPAWLQGGGKLKNLVQLLMNGAHLHMHNPSESGMHLGLQVVAMPAGSDVVLNPRCLLLRHDGCTF